jgi:hypothetical protein
VFAATALDKVGERALKSCVNKTKDAIQSEVPRQFVGFPF